MVGERVRTHPVPDRERDCGSRLRDHLADRRGALLTDEVVDQLQAADDRGVSIIVGGATAAITDSIRDAVPGVTVFESELDWLLGPETSEEVAISRLLLTDREQLLVGSFYPDEGRSHEEQAFFGNGLENGVIVMLRRLLQNGLLPGK